MGGLKLIIMVLGDHLVLTNLIFIHMLHVQEDPQI